MTLNESFRRFSAYAASVLGSPWLFVINVVLILIWLVSGPFFHFSDTWQLLVNTATTVFTYLAVFLIQNTQNRDNAATQLKLDELIRSTKGAHNALLDLEELSQKDLEQFRALYEKLAERSRLDIQSGLKDTGTPEVAPH